MPTRLNPVQPLSALQVIGVRYRGCRPALRDERSLNAYAAAGVYAAAAIPFDLVEPQLSADMGDTSQFTGYTSGDEAADDAQTVAIGHLCGTIADVVAHARRDGKAVLMTGGDCTHMVGMVGGLQEAHGPDVRIGLVWFDAHGDFNTPGTTLSGMLGGMPVAVAAGLAWPRWRELSHIVAPLPTDRIVMVDVRNLDKPEEQLIRATDVVIAAPAAGYPGVDLQDAVERLAARCDLIYLHIDSDILDEAYVPNHGTKEPNGPTMAQVHAAINTVMATGKVGALAIVSVYGEGEGSAISAASGIELIREGLTSWARYGGV